MIILDRISKSFEGTRVLDSISAEIPDKGIFAVCGVSGSGKTTLMRIITGLEQPDSGRVIGTAGKRLAVVFQNDRLIPWLSALENISAVCDEDTARIFLEKVELADSADKKPAELSGGMCRRVALARALAFDADILLLDEPFKGLDSELRMRMAKLVEDFAESRPVILITHDPWEMSLAQKKLNIERK